MRLGKKALMFEGVMFFIILILLTTAFITLYKKQNKFPEDYWLGERQFGLIKTYQKAEKALFYIDQSAKYAAYQTIYELGQKGGFEESACGDYFGYNLWIGMEDKNKIKECYPEKEKLNDNFKSIFNENLNKYLQNYPEIYIPANNYNLQLGGKLKITGFAISDLEIPIGSIGIEVDQSEILEIMEAKDKDARLKIEPTTTKPKIKVDDKYKLEGYNRPSGKVVDRVILHHTGDDASSKAYSTLVKRRLSVHYIVDRDGTVYYLLDERKMALHARGWNARSIGIEIVNTGYKDMGYTEAQYESIKNLIADIAERWPSIAVDNEHIISHYEASETGKWDPSPNFEWAKIGLPEHKTLADLGKTAPKEFGYA